MKWISVKKEEAPAGVPVLATGVNRSGNARVIRAFYAPANTIECGEDSEGEYDEETDQYTLSEGWYECNEFEVTNWLVAFDVLYWMPLPESPFKRPQ